MAAHRFATAPLDPMARAVTFFTAGTLLIAPAVMAVTVRSPAVVAAVVVMGVVIIVLVWAFSPSGYELEGSQLSVRRRLGRPFSAAVEGVGRHPDPQRLGIRTFGSWGAFGWYGRFRRADIGRFTAYLTTREADHIVALRTDRGRVLVSPETPAAFLSAIRKAVR